MSAFSAFSLTTMACQGYTKSPLLGSTLVFFQVANQLTFRGKKLLAHSKEAPTKNKGLWATETNLPGPWNTYFLGG